MSDCTEARFLGDVASHTMTVLRDEGVFRHLRFRTNDSVIMGFDLITWPGRLCIDGDMGTYVFSRIADMFEFFRTKPDAAKGIFVNLGYWAEKVLAADKNGGIMKYSQEVAEKRVRRHLEDIKESWEDMPAELIEAIEEDVVGRFCDGEYAAHEALRDFEWQEEPFFSDTWEWNLREYDYGYVWCCYAIAWGIQQYDAAHAMEGGR